MPAKAPPALPIATEQLARLGQQLRERRRTLGVSATSAAESAGISRVTWHRIEQGAGSVAMAAYASALAVLGLEFALVVPGETAAAEPLPPGIRVDAYPGLRELAWQLAPGTVVTPAEAHAMYERNARHLEARSLGETELRLIAALRKAFGAGV